jgi:hypothetical protein
VIDRAAVLEHVASVHPGWPTGQQTGGIQICSPADWRGRVFAPRSGAELLAYVEQLDGQGVSGIYMRMTTMRTPSLASSRGKATDSVEFPGLWSDIDFAGPGHKHDPTKFGGLTLPPDAESAARVVLDSGLPEPSTWIHSGGGLYALWLLDRPMTLDDDSLIEIGALSERWQGALADSARARGWHYGTGVSDLARVLRLPGTTNRKVELAPAPCRTVVRTGRLSTLGALAGHAPPRQRQTVVTGSSPDNAQRSTTSGMIPFDTTITGGASADGEVSPLDDFEARHDWVEILENAGWRQVAGDASGYREWIRPGKDTPGISATTGRDLPTRDRMYCFSDAAGLPVNEPMTKGFVFALIYHQGDMRRAARALATMGYGSRAREREAERARDPDDDCWAPVDMGPVAHGGHTPPMPTIGTYPGPDGTTFGLLYPGKEHSVAAEPESGKTWLLVFLVRSELAAGNNVVYVDFEDSEAEVGSRMLLVGIEPDVIADTARFRYVRPDIAPRPEQYIRLLDFDGSAPSLVVLDGVTEGYGLFSGEVNSQESASAWRKVFVKPATSRGAATISSDHVIKNKEGRNGHAIGAQHKKAGLNGVLYELVVTAPWGRGMCGRSLLLVHKDRPGGVRPQGTPVPDEPRATSLGSLVLDTTPGCAVGGPVAGVGALLELEPSVRPPTGPGGVVERLDPLGAVKSLVADALRTAHGRGESLSARQLRAVVDARALQVDSAAEQMRSAGVICRGVVLARTGRKSPGNWHLPEACDIDLHPDGVPLRRGVLSQ